MTDLFDDIETLENAIIAFTEGASDEKRMALANLQRMIDKKQEVIEHFEATYGE